MKMSEIEVGKNYSIGYSTGALVLETKVERSTYTGKTRCDGVRVEIFEGWRSGQEQVITSRDVHMLWDEHQEQMEAAKRERLVRSNDSKRNNDHIQNLVNELHDCGINIEFAHASTGGRAISDSRFSVSLTLDNDQMEKLVALAKTSSSKVAAEGIASNNGVPISALDALFG